MTELTYPKAPRHLSAQMRAWWDQEVRAFEMDAHHHLLLRKACEAFDEGERARKVLQKEGQTFTDRFGQPKLRPEAQVLQNATIRFARLLRELQLDAAIEDARIPRIY